MRNGLLFLRGVCLVRGEPAFGLDDATGEAVTAATPAENVVDGDVTGDDLVLLFGGGGDIGDNVFGMG